MKNTIYLFLMGFGLLFFSCKGGEPTADEGEVKTTTAAKNIDYDEMAEGFCKCMTPMFDFQNKLMMLLEEGNQEAVEALRDEAMQVQKDGESCILALEAKYGVVEGVEEEEKATKALEKACPEIMALMGAAAESFEQ